MIIGLLSFSVGVLLFLFLQCAHFGGVGLVLDSEAQILFCSAALFSMASIFRTLRHASLFLIV